MRYRKGLWVTDPEIMGAGSVPPAGGQARTAAAPPPAMPGDAGDPANYFRSARTWWPLTRETSSRHLGVGQADEPDDLVTGDGPRDRFAGPPVKRRGEGGAGGGTASVADPGAGAVSGAIGAGSNACRCEGPEPGHRGTARRPGFRAAG